MKFIESPLVVWMLPQLNKVETDVLCNHIRPNTVGKFMLLNVDKAQARHRLSVRQMKNIVERLELLALFYEIEAEKESEAEEFRDWE